MLAFVSKSTTKRSDFFSPAACLIGDKKNINDMTTICDSISFLIMLSVNIHLLLQHSG